MISHLDKHLNNYSDSMDIRPQTTPNQSKLTGEKSICSLKRSNLLSNLAYNLSKGHYNFASELLKNKLNKKSNINIYINVNETVKYEHLKLEINNSNKKFLLGKTPLILCNYLRESDWALSLTQLLIQNGAISSLKDQCNGCSPLHYACALLKTEIIEYLLRNINQNLNYLIDNNGNSPLFYLLASYACLKHDKQMLIDEKILKVLKTYFNYLKHFNLKINTRNQHGLSFYDLWHFITMKNKFLLENVVFKFTLEAILDENPSVRNLTKLKSTSQIDLKLESNFSYYTLSSRTSIEIFLKRHLLIELKNYKLIHHSAKVDNYLMFIFLNKITPNDLPTNFCLIRNENKLEKNMEIFRKNIFIPMIWGQNYNNLSNKQDNFIEKNLNWRHKFGQLFNSLEIKNSDSYRSSAKYFIEETKEGINSQNNQHQHQHNHHNHHHYHQANQSNHNHHLHHEDSHASNQKSELTSLQFNKKHKTSSLIRK